MQKKKEMTGQRFGRLTVLRENGQHGRCIAWLCRCDCGNEKTVGGGLLRRGTTSSCGCLQSESQRRPKTHGMSKLKCFNNWSAMMQRCFNPKNQDYERYAARGISVCEFLKQSPSSITSIIGDRIGSMEIDRKDNALGYTCGSCAECMAKDWPLNIQWSTRNQQMRNTRKTKRVRIGKVIMCASDWAKRLKIPSGTFFYYFIKPSQAAGNIIDISESDLEFRNLRLS